VISRSKRFSKEEEVAIRNLQGDHLGGFDMAATITISSLSLASDGKTLTGTLGGGTAPYSITNVTGLTLNVTLSGVATTYSLVSASVSGSTLTTVSASKIPSSAAATTITLDLTTASNLIDSASNTPQGQTGVAVTNGSMQVATLFALSACPFASPPGVVAATVGTSPWGGLYTSYSSPYSNYCELAIDVRGSDCTVNTYQKFMVGVDGGSQTSGEVSAEFMQAKAYAGLNDDWHRVAINTPTYLYQQATLVVFGSSPQVRSPAWYGTGYRVTSNEACLRINGAWYEDFNYNALRTAIYWDNGIVAHTAGANTGLRIFCYGTRTWDVYVDEAYASTVTFSNLYWASYDVVEGLSPGPHSIELRAPASAADAGDFYLASLQVVGGTLDTSYAPT
jgi:hypothetical protein